MKTFPLLQSQLGVLLQSMQRPDSTQYNLPNYIFMPLALTSERVVRAVRRLIDHYPVLHTRYVTGDGGEVLHTGGGYATPFAALLLNTYDDLPLRFITAGGEKLDAVYSSHIEIINVYGPTECTDDSSYYSIEPGRRVESIPIGRPVANTWNFIVNGSGRLVPRGSIGELCIAGIQVGRGYWKREDLTAESFVDCPFVTQDRWGRKVRMYRSGDLCRWNEEGQLEFIGRIDEQVKLRGYRIELGEIEARASEFEGISQAVADVRAVGGNDTLCLYYTGSHDIDTDALRTHLILALPEYMVPAAYIQMETIPLTPNGKADRRRLPEPGPVATVEYVAPRTEAEKTLVRLLGDILSWPQPVSLLDNFFALGGDSIKLIRLVSLLAQEGFKAQVNELMKCGTVGDMAQWLVCFSDGPAIDQAPIEGPILAGAFQQRFLSWQLAEPGRFTQSIVLRAREAIRPSLLQQALQAIAVHHDMLRATVADGRIVIRPATAKALVAFEEATLPGQTDVAQAIADTADRQSRLIDLAHGPILRAQLLHTTDGDRLLMVCHHIAVDGVSWRILTDDLTTALTQLTAGQTIDLPRKTHSFAYWTEAVSRYRDSYLLQTEQPYWQHVQEQIEGMERTEPGAHPATRQLTVTLDGEPLRQLLTTSARAYNTEINDLLIAALCQSYHQLTGTSSLSILMEGHGREPLQEPVITDRTVGWFTAAYPLIAEGINGEVRHDVRLVKELLRAVPNKGIGYGILQYVASQEKPIEGAPAGNGVLRTDLTPLVGFNYLGEVDDTNDGEALLATDSSLLRYQAPTTGQLGIPLPSIDINCAVADGRLVARFEYDSERWTADRVQQLADTFTKDLAGVAAHTASVSDSEPTASDFGATGWSEQQLQSITGHFASNGERLERVYPLTPMQEAILMTYLSDHSTTAYRLVYRLSIDVLPTEAQLRRTLDYLGTKHEVLRTAILCDGVPHPCQAIVCRQLGIEMHDLRGESDINAAAAAIHQKMLHRQQSLTDDPLFHIVCLRTGADSCQLLVVTHHIIVDGWCITIILNDFLTKLDAEMSGRQLTATSEQKGRYEAFVRQLLRRDRKAGLAYWKGLLADRLQYMCREAGVRLILSEGSLVAQAMPGYQVNIFKAEQMEALGHVTAPLPQAEARHRFVILYTSGSTGTPKGIEIEHHSIVNYCHWHHREYRLTAADRVLGFSNFSFDAHMIDIYPTLTVGASVYIIGSDMRMDLTYIVTARLLSDLKHAAS